MYLERIKNKLGSTNAKISTGKSETVKKLYRKKGGSIKRTKHVLGGNVPNDLSGNTLYAMGGDGSELSRKKGGAIKKRSKHAAGGNVYGITPSPAAAKIGHKKGKRIKHEHHYLGAMLGALSAASAIPSIVSLFKKR